MITTDRPTTIPGSTGHVQRELWYAFSYPTPQEPGTSGLVLVDHAVEQEYGFNIYVGQLSNDPDEAYCIGYVCQRGDSVYTQYRDGGTTIIASTSATLFIPSICNADLKAQLQFVDTTGFKPIIELESFDHTLIDIVYQRTAPGLIVARK